MLCHLNQAIIIADGMVCITQIFYTKLCKTTNAIIELIFLHNG